MRLLETGSVMFKIVFAIFVPETITPGIWKNTKLEVDGFFCYDYSSTNSTAL